MLAEAVTAFYATELSFVYSGGVRCDSVVEPSSSARGLMCVKNIIGMSLAIFPK